MGNRNLLQNIYLFKKMSGEEVDLITETASLKIFSAGEKIFSQGEPAKALFVIKYGSVQIHQHSSLGDEIEVAKLGTGSHFGEMGFVDGEVRSASATASEKSEIVVFDYSRLAEILNAHPSVAVKFYRELSHFLCGRLRITTTDLSFSREKNLSLF